LALLTGYVLQMHEFPGMLRVPQDGERCGARGCSGAGGLGDRGDDGHDLKCVTR
jgi:hypothetical protein